MLWSRLRCKQIEGVKFRRQFGIGRYVVDFYCPAFRIVIEVDGDSHFVGDAPRYDEERQRYIESLGLRVLRFTNDDVRENIEGVLEQIRDCVIQGHSRTIEGRPPSTTEGRPPSTTEGRPPHTPPS
ncbi:endonuclease domain-containing protein [Candidatus Uhrbacteria bacterium]|nr:endonuclease domain-containing protein [Candidatus Uhrbacteria bacterium]